MSNFLCGSTLGCTAASFGVLRGNFFVPAKINQPAAGRTISNVVPTPIWLSKRIIPP